MKKETLDEATDFIQANYPGTRATIIIKMDQDGKVECLSHGSSRDTFLMAEMTAFREKLNMSAPLYVAPKSGAV